jgi:hypothetical protein
MRSTLSLGLALALSMTSAATSGADARSLAPGAAPAHLEPSAHAASRDAVPREITVPAGTLLRVRLNGPVATDTATVEQRVHGTLSRALVVDGRTVVPAGSAVSGYVADVARSAKVKGRARLALRFTDLTARDTGEHYRISTRTWVRQAPGTKKKDALTIGVPAGAGAAIGGLIDGGKGAAIGAAIGGGGGTAAVLATRGKEVRLPAGSVVAVRLNQALDVER